MKLALMILLAAVWPAISQTNQIILQKRADGWWAIWTNTPPMFRISTSSNMVDWTPWMTKHSGVPLTSMELHIVESNNVRFLKFEPLTNPPVSRSLTDAMRSLTNSLDKQTKTKKPK